MPIDGRKTVWILGAGFSRALGGPLLADLFREEPLDELQAIFPEQQFSRLALDMYMTKRLFNVGKTRGTWTDNPEAFIAEIENAWYLPEAADAQRRKDRILALATASY